MNAASAAAVVAPDAGLLPSASLSGALDVEGVLADLATWSGSLRLQMASRGNALGRMAVAGDVALDVGDGAWRLDGQPMLAGVVPIQIEARGRLAGGSRGQPPLQRAVPDGAAALGIGASTIEGAMRLGETDLPTLLTALRTVGIEATADDAVETGTFDAVIDLGGSLADPSVSMRALLADLAGPRFSLGSADARVSGQPLQPRLSFSLNVPEGLVAGQRLHDLRATGRMTGTSIVLDDLSARQPTGPGAVAGRGAYDMDAAEYTVSIDGAEWLVAATPEQPLAGRLDIRFAGSGTAKGISGNADVALVGAIWQEMSLGRLDATVQLDGQTAHVEARAPDFGAAATGLVRLDAPYATQIDARTGSLDLARLLQGMETPVAIAGSTSLALRVEGPIDGWRAGSATLDVASLDAVAGGVPVHLARPARLRYEAGHVVVDSLEADAGGARLSASGAMPAFEPARGTTGVLVTLTGGVGDVARAVVAAGLTEVPLTGGSGPVALFAQITGSLQAPTIAADLEMGPGSITLRDVPPVSGVRLRAHAENGWLELREAAASYQDAVVVVTAGAPLSWVVPGAAGRSGDAVLHGRATNLTAAILAPFLDTATLAQLTGSVDATLDVAAATPDLAALTGELRVDRLDVRVADLPVTQRVPTHVVARDGFARVEAWDWVGQGATLAVRGQVRLDDRRAALLASGVVDLRMVTPFVRGAGMATAGRLEPRLSITGALDSPRLDGDLTVTDGEIRFADPRMLVSDLDVRTVLARTSARITSLTGSVNGGTLTGGGTFDYSAEGGLEAQLSTSVRGVAMEFPEGLRSEVDADLDLGVDLLRPSGRLSGTVTVARGTYREPLAVVTGLLAGMREGRLPVGAGGRAESSPLLESLTLDVRVLTDEDVGVDNNYGRFQLGADVRVIGTAAAPALAGRAELREGGQLFVGRNVYTVDSGFLDFANPVTIEPDLDVDLRTRVAGHDIQVTIAGTPAGPSVDQRSLTEPELGRAEVASLLLTGRRLENLAPGDAAFVGTQVLGNFSAEVLGFAGRAVGLDTLRLGAADDGAVRRDPTAVATEIDPTTRLTFGKTLGPDVDVTFSQSLRDGEAQTWIVEYEPARALEPRLVSGDDDLRSYGFRHDVALGGPSRAVRPAPVAGQTPGSRVAAVGFSGDPVIPEARLREVLRLGPGDRFDFADWQADRDRLEEEYRREEYLTVRVTPTRTDGPDGIDLDYQIVAGPKTRIQATGIDLSPALRSRIETAWAQSVFDDFLEDEVAQIIRGDLARGRYLQPVVDVRVVEESGARILFVEVDRGTRVARTVVRVEGADDPLARDITARLSQRGVVDGAVLSPAALESEVAGYLRATGHVRARVTAGSPLFEGDVAVVPVTVEAGPAFSVARVSFEGVERIVEDTLRATAALTVGAPYDPGGADAARQRLTELYRREGFPSATVTVRPDVGTDAPVVDVTFVVAEGARHLLGEVLVVGNRAIDPDVIVRALDLPISAPLRVEDLLRARARIFDTGLFRRVDLESEPEDPSVGDGRVVPVRLRVSVEEWPALRLRYGVQATEQRPETEIERRDLAPGLSADVTRRTLFGRAISIGGAVEWRRRERLGRAFLDTGTFFGVPIGSSLVAERSREEFAAATLVTDRSRLTWGQRARVAGNLSLSYAYTFERNHTFDTKPSDFLSLAFDITINIARLTAAAAWDTRNDPVDTSRGSLASFSLEYAPEAVGSDIRFVRQVVQAYHFRPWRGLVFASAARVGAVVPLGGQDLIPSERFFAGGARTVRGVAEGGLGKRDFFGDAAGGRMLTVLNQEVRLPIYRWLRGVGFSGCRQRVCAAGRCQPAPPRGVDRIRATPRVAVRAAARGLCAPDLGSAHRVVRPLECRHRARVLAVRGEGAASHGDTRGVRLTVRAPSA